MKAIILHTIDYKDSSLLVYLYTESGHKSMLVKGVKKYNNKFRMLCDPTNLIEVELGKGSLPILKEAKLLKSLNNIKLNYDIFLYVSYVLELVKNVVDENNNHIKMFSFINRLLSLYNDGIDPEVLTFIFELKLLYFLGYGLNFKHCVFCDEIESLLFSPIDGGLCCSKHQKESYHYYQYEVFKIVYDLYYIDIDKGVNIEIDVHKRHQIRNMIDDMIKEFLSYHSSARKIIKEHIKY